MAKRKTAQSPKTDLPEVQEPYQQLTLMVEDGIQRDIVPNYIPSCVSSAVVTTDSVSSLLQDLPVVAEADEIIARSGKKSIAKVSLDEEVLDTTTSHPLGLYQRAVLEAALSELVAGNSRFTASMLFRTMTGKSKSETASADQQEDIDKAMSQLMYTPLHIDLKSYLPESTDVKKAVLDGPILPAERVTMNVAGVKCTAYNIVSLPIIFRFCTLTQGMTMTPLSLLAVNIRYTKRNLALLNTLQRKIAPILYPVGKEYEPHPPIQIKYSDLYDVADETNVSTTSVRIVRKRVRDTVHAILDSWIKSGYILNWEEITKGREIVAVEISFSLKSPPALPALRSLLSEESPVQTT